MTTIIKKTGGWLYEIKRSFGLIYDPDDYPNAPKPDFVPTPQPQRKPTTTTKVVADDVTYNPRTGQYQRLVNDDSPRPQRGVVADKPTDTLTDNAPLGSGVIGQSSPTNDRQDTDSAPTKKEIFTWEIMSTPQNVKDLNQTRQRLLTKADKLLLHERGLDEAKAQTIKEYWYQKKSRRVASEMLMKESKGYSERIVKDYYAVFNATTIEIESPTLEVK